MNQQGGYIRKVPYFAMSLDEIAKREGLTRERIRQIQNTALRKLRNKGLLSKNLRELGDLLAREKSSRLGQSEAA